MRLLERDPRADSSKGSTFEPTRTTQASNFSFERRGAWSELMLIASMPNWRKHSDSRLRELSCRSTSAARAENFLEEVRATNEFPKSVLRRKDLERLILNARELAANPSFQSEAGNRTADASAKPHS